MKDLAINEQIIAKEVRLVGLEGEQLGIISLKEALIQAEQAGVDLVLISPNATPPVCKLMDYGKYKFELQKKQKEAKKKQKTTEMKVIQLSLNIGAHDMEYRAKQAKNFLDEGAKVKISIMLKGRQQAFANRGIEVAKTFASALLENSVVEKDAYLEGRFITMILAPNKK